MSLRLKLAAAVAAALLVLLVGAASYYAASESKKAGLAVDHTEQVRAQVERTLRTMLDAEAGQRGYLLTGDSTYLRPYAVARTDVDHEMAALRELNGDDAIQRARVDSLALVMDAKLVDLNQSITLVEAGQRDSALKVFLGGSGLALTDRVRTLTGEMEATETRLLARRTAVYNDRKLTVTLITTIGSMIAALLSILTVASIRSSIVQLENAKDIIEEQSSKLAEELDESRSLTQELAGANDQLLQAGVSKERLISALARSNQELDQFAYVASHDLKAPLRGIANLSQWIEEDLGDDIAPDVVEKMSLMRGRVHRLEALIDGVLQYSRAGRARSQTEQVDVGALVREAIELLAPPDEIAIAVDDMPTVVSERTPLQQVFMNLIGNAIKYNRRAGATIHVSVRDAGRFYAFSIADNGPGIEAEYHQRIFGIFQTLESRDRVEGTGIGLSVVKKTVELRGGTVTVDSALGEGATFTFEWPRLPAEDTT